MPSDTQTVTDAEVEPDIQALLNNAFEEIEERGETVTEPASRTRGPDGKFVKPDAPREDADPPEVVASQAVERSEVERPEAPAKSTSVEPPASWAAADKEAFKKIPVEAQEFVMRRHKDMEADYTRKTMEISDLKRDYDPVQQLLAPHMDAIRRGGFTPATLIKEWANVEGRLIGGQGISVVKDMVAAYKLDRAQLARELGLTGAGTQQPPAPDGPAPAQLPPEVLRQLETLQSGHQQVTQILTQQQQERQREAENRVMSTITAFRDAKDANGAPLHPHYDELETEMVDLFNAARASGREPTLDEVYEKAVWANTSTRQKTLESQRAADEAQRKAADAEKAKEARAKAERARKAGSSVTGAPGSGQAAINSAKSDANSIRDTLSAAYDEAMENAV